MEGILNYFKPLEMTETLNTQYPASSAFRKLFFSKEKTHKLKKFNIEIKQGKRKIAPFVKRENEHKQIELAGYNTREYEPPYIKMKGIITPEELTEDKGYGNAVGNIPSPVVVMAEKIQEYHTDFMEMIERTVEIMCIEAVTAFQCTINWIDDNERAHVDTIAYPHLDTHNITATGTDLWTDPDCDKYQALLDMDTIITKDAGKGGERFIVFGENVWPLWFNDEALMAKLDNRRIELGKIKPEYRDIDGMRLEMAVHGLGQIYTYQEWYTDPVSGDDKAMFPTDIVFMSAMPNKIQTRLNFGCIFNLKLGKFDVKYFTLVKEDSDGEKYETRIETAPLPVPTEINCFVVSKVI